MAARNVRSPALCWLDLESLWAVYNRGRTSHSTTQPDLDCHFYAHPDQHSYAHTAANRHTHPQPDPAADTGPIPIADADYQTYPLSNPDSHLYSNGDAHPHTCCSDHTQPDRNAVIILTCYSFKEISAARRALFFNKSRLARRLLPWVSWLTR